MGIKHLKNYIDGEWVESQSKELLEVRNPATDEVIAHVPLSTAEEVERLPERRKRHFKTGVRQPLTPELVTCFV